MSKPEVSEKEMLDTLEHCRVNMALGVVQAYAGKWTEQDERTIDAIRRLIEKAGEWKNRAIKITEHGTSQDAWLLAWEIRDFGKGKE